MSDFRERYPHGVLTEQEGGVPNDAFNWEAAWHVCRKHRVVERVCRDAERRRPGFDFRGRPIPPAENDVPLRCAVVTCGRPQGAPHAKGCPYFGQDGMNARYDIGASPYRAEASGEGR